MSTTVPIPGGEATIRDELVTERQFRVIESAMVAATPGIAKGRDVPEVPEDGTDEERAAAVAARLEAALAVHVTRDEAAAMLVLRDAKIVAFLESWTLKQPLPTIDTVQDLPRDLYLALAAATGEKTVDLSGTDFSVSPDAESPTAGSRSSDGPSRASSGPEPSSTPDSSQSGESTATGSATAA